MWLRADRPCFSASLREYTLNLHKSEQAQEPWPVAPPVSNFAREHTAERLGNQEGKQGCLKGKSDI
jgi:hypothetical protein